MCCYTFSDKKKKEKEKNKNKNKKIKKKTILVEIIVSVLCQKVN